MRIDWTQPPEYLDLKPIPERRKENEKEKAPEKEKEVEKEKEKEPAAVSFVRN